MSEQLIFHMCKRHDWQAAQGAGQYVGSGDDLADGFMHFSTAEQVAESAGLHRNGVTDLLLIAVDADRLGPALKWESSRGGQLFPHLYGGLDVSKVISARELPLGDDGLHVFPEGIPPWRPGAS
ncbi:MAG: DUF952 domain-containing protein [Rhodospirillaceae bacterium]|jgi:uncharacterized protein (DUF952 family)|nr:DUF952 domain-containing protein [Rhodospirillaceae bacterium]MBT5243818.1 DUF952 domain-containing protein [Rhodospirillaceae bacterium]MBT5563762.1 DUF952 domain-containing protein [Rhodospirillaceae bacterium]MBT6242788.1 DUF952 domain-containing protein [Rhodospirillaceae bacterium]MBT7137492.1 DUF952 domain-containing protein [Rhodospirillaceae bacterium]